MINVVPSGRTRSNVSNIFYWNHVSDKLTLSEKAELKAHYLKIILFILFILSFI